ncbi:bifunctional adenosylcobinamide kinase/adenosylcobinamide-phosphate guanylyltransferase [Ferrimonas aestuarii]|uniref:Bifunctional adenosylcobalamin biosynthesis protein n=1 Tax=Ferrimonas aestuarii TaxID=2569539 RepID=A0A4U1BGH2_9GAMM|nr:bifunctional adenosylcobinamide kinase/adenosylcobinamide-phosphate guanylyltransferase [Ferrimonas aestuarii]TKB50072.1 bifunctional adenosylcobinamide kinase/adenosylcobinamide-phosphate guanylyltransferase [Ferrimonas aestuarii]
MLSLYLGGARSGKSTLAEEAAFAVEAKGKRILYVATAERHPSMAERIELHQRRRPASWYCIEEPRALAQLLLNEGKPNTLILVDCLTLWLTNQLLAEADMALEQRKLLQVLAQVKSQAEVVLVSTEVGHGLIPDDALTQNYVAAAGELHQGIGEIADALWWCSAGRGIEVKTAQANSEGNHGQ